MSFGGATEDLYERLALLLGWQAGKHAVYDWERWTSRGI